MKREPKLVEIGLEGEFGFLAQYTLDGDVARALLYEHALAMPYWQWDPLMVLADWVRTQRVVRAGYWRWHPCSRSCWCDNPGGFKGHLNDAEERGHGAFTGVLLDR